MERTTAAAIATAMLCLASGTASASIVLYEHGLNIDGSLTTDTSWPAGVDASAFDVASGLGRLSVTVSSLGAHEVLLYLDHEIDEEINTYFNEVGSVGAGAPVAGQSWEIDEPGFSATPGDIYTNWMNGSLDNSIGFLDPDDVAMAMGFDFVLAPDERGVVSFFTSTVNAAPGFFLRQFDPDSQSEIFFWASLQFERGEPVPEPGPLALLALGLLVLTVPRAVARRRRM
jgi:hypothetical protein